jgi:hypothetical protein
MLGSGFFNFQPTSSYTEGQDSEFMTLCHSCSWQGSYLLWQNCPQSASIKHQEGSKTDITYKKQPGCPWSPYPQSHRVWLIYISHFLIKWESPQESGGILNGYKCGSVLEQCLVHSSIIRAQERCESQVCSIWDMTLGSFHTLGNSISWNLHSNPINREGHWDSERFSDMLKIKQLLTEV